jgi:hypothetical protein
MLHHHPLETRYDSQLLWMNHNPKPYEPWMTQLLRFHLGNLSCKPLYVRGYLVRTRGK